MFKKLKTLLSLIVVALFTTVSAANLTGYLPNSTAFAFGGVDLKANENTFDTFVNEWNNLGLTDLFESVMDEELGGEEFEFNDEFEGLTLLDVIGTEFWLAVGADFFESEDMMPDVVAVTALTGDAKAIIQGALDTEVAEGSTVVEHIGEMPVYVHIEDEIAVGFDGDVLVFGLSVDSVAEARSRNLNRMAGVAQSPAWANTVGAVPNGTLYTFMNFAALSEPAFMLEFIAGEGIGTRVQGILEAIGTVGQVFSVTSDGIEVETRVLHGSGGAADAGLVAILANSANYPANPALDRFVADGALAYQNMGSQPSASWTWFNSLFDGLPLLEEIGFDSNVNDLIAAFTGVDVTADLLSWMTGEAAMITLSYPSEVSLDALTMNTTDVTEMNLSMLMGDSVLVLGVTDANLANNTIMQLFPTIGMFAGMLMDPFGEEMNFPMAQMSNVSGVTVSGWPLLGGDEPTLYTAVVDSYLVFGTSAHAMERTIDAYNAGGGVPASLYPTIDVPAGASSYSYSNAQAAFDSVAKSYASQMATMGMLFGDDEDIDFETVEVVGDALIEFLEFVGSRFSYASGYTVYDNGVIVNYAKTLINW